MILLRTRYYILLTSLLFIFGCSGEEVILDGFQKTKWIEDSSGCNGNRTKQLDVLRKEKNKLKGLTSESIDRQLGKPNTRDLDKRHKLYYVYEISGAADCNTQDQKRIYLQIRFNAMNKADELVIFQ